MKTAPLSPVLGAFRILRQRAQDTGASPLTLWTNVGEKAAVQHRDGLSAAAHASEVHDQEAAQEIAAGIAGLADGRADPEDLAHFARAERLVTRSAELDHDIGEAVRS